MGSIKKRPLKAFVRYDGKGRIVAGSLILRRKTPKVGNWKEIPAYKCCNPYDIDCLEYSLTVGAETVQLWYTTCATVPMGPVEVTGPTIYTFCGKRDTVTTSGGEIAVLGNCSQSTSTTTTTTTT